MTIPQSTDETQQANNADDKLIVKTKRAWWKKLVKRFLYYLVAVVSLGLSAQAHHFALTAGLAIVVSALGLAMHRVLAKKESLEGPLSVKLLVWSLVFEVGVGICASQDWRILGFVGFLGLSMMAFGLGQLAAEVRSAADICGAVALLFVLNCVAALVAAIVFGLGGGLLLMVAIVMAYPAIGFGTEFLLNAFDARDKGWLSDLSHLVVLGAIGAATAAIGTLLILDVGGLRFAVLIAVLVAVFVGMVASNTDADMLFILFAFAVVWSQVPRGDLQPPIFTDGADKHAIVVLGDSYISGEGARQYLAGTNTREPRDYDQCRRSQLAWAIRVAETDDLQLDFVACSGAKAKHITTEGQYLGENPGHEYVTSADGNARHLLSQIELYKERALARETARSTTQVGKATLDWVFVSIGGNDAGFGDLVADCLSPGDCSLGGQKWLNGLHDDLEPTLSALYDSLSDPDKLKDLGIPEFAGKVVVVPYPIPIAETGCGIFDSTFTEREHKFLNGFTTQMDAIIERQAAEHGLRFISAMRTAFEDAKLRICDTEAASAAVNYIALNPVGGDTDPTGWVHNSMHPNEVGHEVMADVVHKWLAGPPGPEDSSKVVEPSLSLTEIMEDGNQYCSPTNVTPNCVAAEKVPSSERLPRVARHGSVAVLVIVLGSWALSLSILARRRKVRADNSTDKWAVSKFIDHLSIGARIATGAALIGVTIAFMYFEGRVVGLINGYGNAQFETAADLKGRTLASQTSLFAASWRDLIIYVPVYVVYGIVVILSVRPHHRNISKSRLLSFLRVDDIPRVSLWAIIVLIGAGIADLVETILFRRSLGRLRDLHAKADIDTLTVVTQYMTATKFALGLLAAGLLIWSVISRGAPPPEPDHGTAEPTGEVVEPRH